MISSDLNFANSRMGIATMIIQKPDIGGLFSPGGGFEIVATGRIAAPELPADASKFYIIVQDFKEGMSESGSGEFAKPIAAVFALYQSRYHLQPILMYYLFYLANCIGPNSFSPNQFQNTILLIFTS